jgi:hypothetical protein
MPIALPDRLPVAPPSVASTRLDSKAPVPEASVATPTPFAKLVHALGHEAERGEATVRSVLRGATGGELSSTDLLALQAGIYRYGETIDLVAKLVDKAGTDVKTVLTGSQ